MTKPAKRTGDKRAKRRAIKESIKEIAKKIYPNDPEAVKLADHLKNCSCWMCGNARRFAKGKHRLTRQEKIVLDRETAD